MGRHVHCMLAGSSGLQLHSPDHPDTTDRGCCLPCWPPDPVNLRVNRDSPGACGELEGNSSAPSV